MILAVLPVAIAAAVVLTSENAVAAERIVLRNLEIIRDQPVASFDEDGVRLRGGRVIAWDEIERANVAPEKQAAFDRMLQTLGAPLYRIRRRLKVGDYGELAEPTEAVYARYVGRNSKTAYMVLQATMWSRLATGKREAALEPYLYCYDYLQRRGGQGADLPGSRRLQYDRATGTTPELLPVWFDAAAAKTAMPRVLQAAQRMQTMPKGVHLYYATLATTGGDAARGRQVLTAVTDTSGPLAEMKLIAMAQGEVLGGQPGASVGKLAAEVDSISSANRPLAVYWLGKARLASSQERVQQEGILQLLTLPALYGKSHPVLAAAGLHRAMVALAARGDGEGAQAVRDELLTRYGQTYHAEKARNERDKPE